MTWLSRNVATLFTLAALLIGGAAAYGRIDQICTRVEVKADKEAVTREMDLVHKDLERIEAKIDSLIFQKQQK
jgi:hypothetical protein